MFLSVRRRWSRSACAVGLLTSLACGACSPSFNVRAFRAYANEVPDEAVVLDRERDLRAAVALADELLTATPYTPGDAWIRQLALDDTGADRWRDRIKAIPPYDDGEHEIPILTIYRMHVGEVLQRARAGKGRYTSVLDAAAALSPELAPLREKWLSLSQELDAKSKSPKANEPPEQSAEAARRAFAAITEALRRLDARDPGKAAIAQDLHAALSVALRLDLEALALVSSVKSQAKGAQNMAARDLFVTPNKAPSPLAGVPAEAAAVERVASAQRAALEDMTGVLTLRTGVKMDATPGFALRESIVDQVVGVSIDATHLRAKLDSDLLFYHSLGAIETGDPKSRKDPSLTYLGRTQRLAYDLDPVFLLGGRLLASFDWLHLQNAATLNAGFTTDRLFSRGGDIATSASLGEQLGIKGFASDLFDLGIGLVGIKTNYQVARFTAGTVTQVAVDPQTGADTKILGTAPLRLELTKLDIGYDLATWFPEWASERWIEEVYLGFRYMNYALPRILYQLDDVSAADEASRFVLTRQSPPQTVSSRYYMGGAVVRFGQGDGRRVSLFGDVGLYGGSGPSSYYFLKSAGQDDLPTNRDPGKSSVLVFDGTAALGARFRLTPNRLGRFRVLVDVQYRADVIHQLIISEVLATTTKDENGKPVTTYSVGKQIDFGGTDVFHGPRLQLVGVF